MSEEKDNVILKVDRQGFLMTPKSGQQLFSYVDIPSQNFVPFSLAHPVLSHILVGLPKSSP